jgi:hypothetical protein
MMTVGVVPVAVVMGPAVRSGSCDERKEEGNLGNNHNTVIKTLSQRILPLCKQSLHNLAFTMC